MGLQPTASRTALLLQCPRPFSPEVNTPRGPVGEAALYGTEFHLEMQKLAEGAPPNSETAAGRHAQEAWFTLQDWLGGKNEWAIPLRIIGVERHLAYSIVSGETREVLFDAETHHYAGLEHHEIAGTYDLLLESIGADPPFRVVLDHKTGEGDFGRPSSLPQLRTLAILTGAEWVAVLHAPRGQVPMIYSGEVFPHLPLAGAEIAVAMRLIDSGFLRPGPECGYCPARGDCPGRYEDALVSASSLVRTVTEAPLKLADSPGAVHMFLTHVERLAGQFRAELRERVRGGEIIERPDGKILEITTKTYERLSKKSIAEALGPQKAEELFAMLRQVGALVETEQEELRAK